MSQIDRDELSAAANAAAGPESVWGNISPMRTPGLHDVTVMMVDDEPMMTDVIQTYLEEAGYSRFVSVNDPLQAIEQARRHRPGLLLLDLMMPGLSGFDILSIMRNDEELRYIPVIVLTAANNPTTRLRALELGATEFLSKPVDSSELVLRVRNSLVFKLYQDRLANMDPLTGLPNRRVFLERLRNVMVEAQERRASMALLHIGLDRFKQINDSLGHRAGDQLLADVAVRLQTCLRRGDGTRDTQRSEELRAKHPNDALFLSRLAGDEFALLIPELGSPETGGRVASRILTVMARPFQHEGQDLFVTPSIGIAVYPGDGLDDETLRRSAESALAHAKDNGRNNFRYYSPHLNSASTERLGMQTRLRRAIERKELLLHFQPKVELATGQVVGAEALLRWVSPELGLVPPDRFIPMAEESGLIVEFGEWVLQAACAQMAQWREAGHGNIKVAINVSRHEVVAGGLVGTVAKAIERHAIQAGQLVIELTEGMLMDRHEQTRQQLEALRAMGVEISIDDFGTGYSSMNYLKRFPLDELKIDRSFVNNTPDDPINSAIVKAVIVLAHSLGMRVVAEGVETEPSRTMLQELGCDLFQGYLCSKPMPAPEFMALLGQINATP
jgi:predicted signal transduction protein with EAL and GGDEF domain